MAVGPCSDRDFKDFNMKNAKRIEQGRDEEGKGFDDFYDRSNLKIYRSSLVFDIPYVD